MTAAALRSLHPAAWWVWAIGLAVAATRTTNPLLLGLILVVALTVVASRQPAVPWAAGLRLYLVLAILVVAVRVIFRMVLGGGDGGTVLFALPEIPLPEAARGIRIGGPVSAEGLAAAFYDGLRLATMLVCVGAANLLADPRRLLKSVPGALYEIGTAVVVALTIAPQLVVSVGRVRRAQSLRGEAGGRLTSIRRSLVPVLTDALDNSLHLAAAMGSRGYGRTAGWSASARRRAGGLLLGGLMGICIGLYGLLDASAPRALAWPALLSGAAVAIVGLVLSGHRTRRSRYRAEVWGAADVATVMAGVVAALGVTVAGSNSPTVLHPSTFPLVWPSVSLLATGTVLLAALPAVITPRPSSPGAPETLEEPSTLRSTPSVHTPVVRGR
ncbi:energy-coupling factor transporter transmembrane component T family protein [Euzebya tangerina]|uniref:energy-coupling factor transporter transmembrane component T family protein n=1 Tax=Euzebya tangerina TaxID=591198 RepID=UPI000E31B9FE|nr:energy-coupling factor transporter transmembrane component T [Euzebya tangerina]